MQTFLQIKLQVAMFAETTERRMKTNEEKISSMLIVMMWVRDNLPALPKNTLTKVLAESLPEVRNVVKGLALEYSLLQTESACTACLDKFEKKSKSVKELQGTIDEAMSEVFSATYIIDNALRCAYNVPNGLHKPFSMDVLGLMGRYCKRGKVGKLELEAEIEEAYKHCLKNDHALSYQSFKAGYLCNYTKLIEP